MKVNKITIHAPLSLSALISHFQNAIADSDYKEMIKISPQGTKAFSCTISKAGTSTLSFTEVAEKRIDGECTVALTKADIAFFHKSSIPAVMEWITKEVEKIGGTVVPE